MSENSTDEELDQRGRQLEQAIDSQLRSDRLSPKPMKPDSLFRLIKETVNRSWES